MRFVCCLKDNLGIKIRLSPPLNLWIYTQNLQNPEFMNLFQSRYFWKFSKNQLNLWIYSLNLKTTEFMNYFKAVTFEIFPKTNWIYEFIPQNPDFLNFRIVEFKAQVLCNKWNLGMCQKGLWLCRKYRPLPIRILWIFREGNLGMCTRNIYYPVKNR
jgi:hypothetical protein